MESSSLSSTLSTSSSWTSEVFTTSLTPGAGAPLMVDLTTPAPVASAVAAAAAAASSPAGAVLRNKSARFSASEWRLSTLDPSDMDSPTLTLPAVVSDPDHGLTSSTFKFSPEYETVSASLLRRLAEHPTAQPEQFSSVWTAPVRQIMSTTSERQTTKTVAASSASGLKPAEDSDSAPPRIPASTSTITSAIQAAASGAKTTGAGATGASARPASSTLSSVSQTIARPASTMATTKAPTTAVTTTSGRRERTQTVSSSASNNGVVEQCVSVDTTASTLLSYLRTQDLPFRPALGLGLRRVQTEIRGLGQGLGRQATFSYSASPPHSTYRTKDPSLPWFEDDEGSPGPPGEARPEPSGLGQKRMPLKRSKTHHASLAGCEEHKHKHARHHHRHTFHFGLGFHWHQARARLQRPHQQQRQPQEQEQQQQQQQQQHRHRRSAFLALLPKLDGLPCIACVLHLRHTHTRQGVSSTRSQTSQAAQGQRAQQQPQQLRKQESLQLHGDVLPQGGSGRERSSTWNSYQDAAEASGHSLASVELASWAANRLTTRRGSSPFANICKEQEFNEHVQASIIKLFQRKPLKENELGTLLEHIKVLSEAEAGALIYPYYRDQLLKKGMVILREKIKNEQGAELLEMLGETWDYFFTQILPTLQALMFPLTEVAQCYDIRNTTLLEFRNIVVLKVGLKEAIEAKKYEVPDTVRQMLLVLQGVHDPTFLSKEQLDLEKLVACVVVPFLGSRGLYQGSPEPVMKANYRPTLPHLNLSKPKITITVSDPSILEDDGDGPAPGPRAAAGRERGLRSQPSPLVHGQSATDLLPQSRPACAQDALASPTTLRKLAALPQPTASSHGGLGHRLLPVLEALDSGRRHSIVGT